MTTREGRLRRAERLREWSDKREARADAGFKAARAAVAGIPFGQPILVGHHSERRHRRDLERHDSAMRRAVDDSNKAGEMSSRAANIEEAADRAIYMDDPDAIERLTAKIADLERQRDAMKAANLIVRNKKIAPEEKPARLAELLKCKPETAAKLLEPDYCGRIGFASYVFQNLSGTITKERKRLAQLTELKTPKGEAIRNPTASTPLERAGMTITATMTTPRKAWKKPRPVWNVTGNLAFWSPLLTEVMGGTVYHGVVSFWDDPTEQITAAILEAEERDKIWGFAFEVVPAAGVAPVGQVFEQHQTDDPHCTCNDCMGAYESRVSR